ncbi:MAG: 30S ribosome-binding factor RbfA [Candidatus Liptonbacteria bacterium]|nr:30S ribosome-binding factor RbfA [Candidatus Liptonbacteria bacterium]
MKHFRPERVGGLIQEELGKILLRRVESRGELLTITSVDVDKKLEHAIVYVSVLVPGDAGDAERRAEKAVKMLEARQPYLQSLLYRTLNIRPMPTIVFRRDRGLERAAGVERALLGR